MTIHPLTPADAPEASREMLEGAARAFGFVPNLLGNMAHAPALLEAYMAVASAFNKTSLTPTERHIVLLTTSVRHGCTYCVAAHSATAGMQKVPAPIVEALRAGQPLADPKLDALRRFTLDTVESRGWPSEQTVRDFLGAGYTEAQALEVLVGIGQKTLSNYTNHLAGTPLDEAFATTRWNAPATP
ncbi:MAG: carboxymuconolactone decarboxylase family protein [Vicinamibacterales bacterium]